MELMTSYERRGMEKGKQEGRQEGKIEGKQDSICTFLEAKFGSSTDVVQKQVRSINDLPVLEEVLKKVFSAASLEDAKKIIGKSAKI
ncbi:hypothetical protein [Shouchella shacheensis]|uniref:hypothetical protein n=1 Tax=Shouchella shacheensis TaxID=1649580 RepID=UPI000A881BD8|nr:hypothetical protein [Shouchella shacheensis]